MRPSAAPRDRGLQAERTALSWNRTALAVAVNAGLALRAGSQSGRLALVGLGVILLVAAGAVALYGAYRRDRLLFGDKPAAVPAVAMAAVAGIVALACAAGIASILAVHQPGSSGTQDGARPPARAVHR